jgi:hypothetical protein
MTIPGEHSETTLFSGFSLLLTLSPYIFGFTYQTTSFLICQKMTMLPILDSHYLTYSQREMESSQEPIENNQELLVESDSPYCHD